MIIQREFYEEVRDEIFELIQAHSDEIDLYTDKLVVAPREDIYLLMEDNGTMFIYTCRDEDYKLIAYSVYLVEKHLHYKDFTYANNDLLYVIPEERNTGVIQKLFSFAEEDLIKNGVDVITFNFKVSHDHPVLAEEMGYDRAEIVYSKYIGSNA